jgi:hypothetical protein
MVERMKSGSAAAKAEKEDLRRIEAQKKLAELDERIDKPKPDPIMPRSTDTVTVACKLPNGLRLRIFKMREISEQAPGGPRTIEQSFQVGPTIVVRGPALPFGVVPSELIIGGYALTKDVPRDFWETWLEQNVDLDCVQKGLIFARKNTDDAVAKAKDRSTIKSGLEPLDPNKLPNLSDNRHVKLEPASNSDFQ